MEFKIKAADIIIDIRGQYPYLEEYCRNYITEEPDADLKIEITRKEIQAEANYILARTTQVFTADTYKMYEKAYGINGRGTCFCF